MEQTGSVSTASAQVKTLSKILAADATIPAAHKNLLQTIFSFLLNLAPYVLEIFLGDDGEIPTGLTNPIPTVTDAFLETQGAMKIAQHPISDSLSTIMHTAATAAPENKGVLDKIFAFVLKILPTILGLFSHGQAQAASTASSAAGVGNGGTPGGGQTPGAGGDAGSVSLGSGDTGAGVAAASNN